MAAGERLARDARRRAAAFAGPPGDDGPHVAARAQFLAARARTSSSWRSRATSTERRRSPRRWRRLHGQRVRHHVDGRPNQRGARHVVAEQQRPRRAGVRRAGWRSPSGPRSRSRAGIRPAPSGPARAACRRCAGRFARGGRYEARVAGRHLLGTRRRHEREHGHRHRAAVHAPPFEPHVASQVVDLVARYRRRSPAAERRRPSRR